MILDCYVMAADMDETWRLWNTICAWWPAIEVLIATGVSNARTEAANTGIKQIKRTGRAGSPQGTRRDSQTEQHYNSNGPRRGSTIFARSAR